MVGCQGEAGSLVEVAGGCDGVERLDAGPEVGDGFGAAGRLDGEGEVQGPVGVVHRGVKIDVTGGEGGSGQGGSAQCTATGPVLVAGFGG